MRVLVLYSHPVDTSFCSAVHQTVLTALAAGGHEVRDRDLYAENFQPALTRNERINYFDAGLNQQTVRRDVDDIRWAEGLVFVYPTWWYGLPAILKGWLDRVWLPHVAFTLTDDPKLPLKPNMTNIRYLAGVTTYGSPWWLVKWSGEPGRKTLLRGIRPLCHRRCKTAWHALYKMDVCSQQDRQRFLAAVERAFGRLA